MKAALTKKPVHESQLTVDFGLVYKDGARLLVLGQGINSRAHNTVDWMVCGPLE